MELCYAQNLEDYHLSLAFSGLATGAYIDIGAGHPLADNVSFWFYEHGWAGLVVEPQPELPSLYPQLRPRDTVVRALIGRETGEHHFYLVKRLHGFSTIVEPHRPRPSVPTTAPCASSRWAAGVSNSAVSPARAPIGCSIFSARRGVFDLGDRKSIDHCPSARRRCPQSALAGPVRARGECGAHSQGTGVQPSGTAGAAKEFAKRTRHPWKVEFLSSMMVTALKLADPSK